MNHNQSVKRNAEQAERRYNRFKLQETKFDIQGHRGCRGLMPENTIGAFIEALKLGASTLHMDAVICGDGKVVISGEPWISPESCLAPDGSSMASNERPNIYRMTYEEVCRYDCGKKINPLFPLQKSISAVKPLLSEVFNRVEKYIMWNSFRAVHYNIEIKSCTEWENVYQPSPEDAVANLLEVLRSKNIQRRCILQSRDERILKIVKETAPQMRVSFVADNDETIDDCRDKLGFTPDVFSPNYRMVDALMIIEAQSMGMKIIPWHVNDLLDMNQLLQMGADGIITDYPDIAVKLIE